MIRLVKEDFIGIITIDHPPANSLSSKVLSELGGALGEALSDPSLRALIITGGGEKIFASGADINELGHLDKAGGSQIVSRVKEVFSKIWLGPKPVFCALNGHALGGGLELALHCDFRIATEKTRLGQPEINLGVLPGAGGTQLLPRLVGLSKARWLLFSGETLSAQEALECGLVDRVVKAEFLLESTKEMALQIAEKPPLAIKAVKKMLRFVQSPGLEEALENETELFGELCATEDKREGVLAFLEKRKANFQGK
ncbi:MAG: enoyl-CoA hydratase-related protein [Pseudomonadota bacterium]